MEKSRRSRTLITHLHLGDISGLRFVGYADEDSIARRSARSTFIANCRVAAQLLIVHFTTFPMNPIDHADDFFLGKILTRCFVTP